MQTELIGVGRTLGSVSLQHNSKMNDREQSVQTWYTEWSWDILEMMWVLGLKDHRINKCIFHTNDYYAYHMLMHIWLTTAIRRVFELYECLLADNDLASIILY